MATLKDHEKPYDVVEQLREHSAVRSVQLATSTFDEPVYIQATLTDECTDTTRLTRFMSENKLTLSMASITSNNRLHVNLGYDE